MKRLILLTSLICAIVSCGEKKPKPKSVTYIEYNAIDDSGSLKKGEVKVKYSIGYNLEGNQTYFVGLIGYNNSDTTWTDKKYSSNKKIEGNKTFYYDNTGNLVNVQVQKGDTVFLYNGNDFENPLSFSVFKDKNRLISEHDLLLREKKTYKNTVFDKYGRMVYSIVVKEYFPSSTDTLFYNEIELAKMAVENYSVVIIEQKFEDY